MSLIEFGLIFKNEKVIIFSNLNNPIVYDTTYDLNSVPIIDWSISETYNDELKEIRFKDHLLTLLKCIVKDEPVYCYSITKRPDNKKFQKKLDKLISNLEKEKKFNSLEDLKLLCFKFLIKESFIKMQR